MQDALEEDAERSQEPLPPPSPTPLSPPPDGSSLDPAVLAAALDLLERQSRGASPALSDSSTSTPAATSSPTPSLEATTHSRRRQARRKRHQRRQITRIVSVTLLGLITVLGAGVLVSGSFGAWTSTISRSQQAGTLTLNINLADPETSAGWSKSLNQTFGPFAPGTTDSRYVGVVNSGSVGSVGSLGLSVVPGTPRGGSGTVADFQAAVEVSAYYCSGTWSPTDVTTCTGGEWAMAGVRDASLASLSSAQALSGLSLAAANSLVGLRLDYKVGASASSTLEGTTLPVTWTFTATQAT